MSIPPAASPDLWLKAATKLGPFPTPPPEQFVAELLARHPWSGWSATGEVPFHWEYVDRPAAGTALLAFFHPPHRAPPPDGLRYLPSQPYERISLTTHTVTCPTSLTSPTSFSSVTVELECHTIVHGHHPPTSRNSGLLPDSPELSLCRFRKRYRIRSGGGHPGLWFVYWGRDDTGGAGPSAGPAPIALAGWEREPVRAYPLPQALVSADPVFVFGSRNRVPSAAGQLPGLMQPHTAGAAAAAGVASGMMGMPRPPSTGGSGSHPASQTGSGAVGGQPSFSTPYARQQQQSQHLAQLASASTNGLQIQQQLLQNQYLQQAQHAQLDPRAMLAGQAQPPGAPLHHPHPSTSGAGSAATTMPIHPSQLHAHQQAQAQQMAQLLQQQQQQKQRRPGMPILASPRAMAGQQMPGMVMATSNSNAGGHHAHHAQQDPSAYGDIFDIVTSRTLAVARFARNHELLAGVLDPWRVNSILEGKKRIRVAEEKEEEEEEEEKEGRGFARLASTATRGEGERKGLDVRERRERLEKMLEREKKEAEEMERRHRERVGRLVSEVGGGLAAGAEDG